jgi:hypothetical protein
MHVSPASSDRDHEEVARWLFRVVNKYEEAHVQSWTLIQDHAVSCAVILRSLFIANGCHKTSFFWPLVTEKRI